MDVMTTRRGDIPDGTVTYQGMGGSEQPADAATCRGPCDWAAAAIAPPARKVRYAVGCA